MASWFFCQNQSRPRGRTGPLKRRSFGSIATFFFFCLCWFGVSGEHAASFTAAVTQATSASRRLHSIYFLLTLSMTYLLSFKYCLHLLSAVGLAYALGFAGSDWKTFKSSYRILRSISYNLDTAAWSEIPREDLER
jgi:hypothetical protein